MHAVVECSSVNRKQTEVSLSAARELLFLEPKIREEVLKSVGRGRVNVSLEILSTDSEKIVDVKRAKSYLSEITKLKRTLALAGDVRIETILAGPGVVRSGPAAGDPWPVVQEALSAALSGLLQMRDQEGKHLKKVLLREMGQLEKIARKVRPLAARAPIRQRALMLERLKRAGLDLDIGEPRVLVEIAVFAERADISEELDRLESHGKQFSELLQKDGPIGRTLEFLTQELGREWNTIGSKASDVEISRFVVEAKTALDRLREQLANIE
jgi:uncharacterized protein (TIGR00255 family)